MYCNPIHCHFPKKTIPMFRSLCYTFLAIKYFSTAVLRIYLFYSIFLLELLSFASRKFLLHINQDGVHMHMFTLQDERASHATAVPDLFLDYYMPSANGEFVKVYLYLLRAAGCREVQASLSSIADFFFCTETDVVRALKYWEKAGILALSFDGNGIVTGIRLLPLSAPAHTGAAQPSLLQNSSQAAAPESSAAAGQKQAEVSARPQNTKPCQLSPGRIQALKDNEEIRQLLFLSEQYLGRTLSPTDIGRLLYFYDELHFSAELLEYLVEYCVSKGSTSLHYIEKVGLAWHESGVTTVEMAKQETTTYNRKYFPILKAFGIRGRNPVPKEIADMDRWMNEYGFSQELILEACARTIAQTGQPSFSYAEGILSKWKSQNVRSLFDIQALDAQHKKNQKTAARESASQKSSPANRFNNFQQRNYDYSELEKQLVDH